MRDRRAFEETLTLEGALEAGFDSLVARAARAQASVVDHIKGSPAIKRYLATLPQGAGTFCPVTELDQLVLYLAIQKGRVDKSSAAQALDFVEQFVLPVLAFERETVAAAMITADDVTREEQDLIRLAIKLAGPFDDLWASWYKDLVIPHQSLSDDEKAAFKKKAKSQLSEFDYTVYDWDGRSVANRRTWAQAFPEEIAEIARAIAEFQTSNGDLKAFLEAMRYALICTNIGQLEQRWAEVDEAWMAVPADTRLLPVHGIENGYEHPTGVSPDFRLLVRTDRYQDDVARMRVATVKFAPSFGLDDQAVELAATKLARMQVAHYLDPIRAGVCGNFRAAGQVLPNRQKILAQGGRILLMSSEATTRMYQDILYEHGTPEMAAMLAGYVTDGSMVGHTIGHEFFHPVGRAPQIDKRLRAVIHDIDEGKASAGGLWVDDKSDPSEERRLISAATCTARVLRFMQKAIRTNPTVQPYVTENLVVADAMFKAGLLRLTKQGVAVDLKVAKSGAWLKPVKAFATKTIGLYGQQDEEGAAVLIKRFQKMRTRQGPVRDLIEWVDRDLKN